MGISDMGLDKSGLGIIIGNTELGKGEAKIGETKLDTTVLGETGLEKRF